MAITASELRIGNYIYNDNVVVKIDARSIFNIWDKSNKYSPIPIAEDWLLKFGFEKGNNINVPINVYSLNLNLDDIYSIIKYEIKNKYVHLTQRGVSVYLRELEYIHQLQNLYFALTGQELIYGNYSN